MSETKIQPRADAALQLGPAIEAAAQLGKDGVEVLERLHAIQVSERAAAAKAEFMRAMAELRADLPPIVRSVPGQHGTTQAGTRTKGMYAPLDTITPVLDPLAAAHGFSYYFDREVVGDRDFILCIVTHAGGHEIRTRFPAPADTGPGRNAIQAIASGESYAKRYALVAAFGITTADPDDDGQAAGTSRAPAGPVITEEQAANVHAMLTEINADERFTNSMLVWAGAATVEEIPAAKFDHILRKLEDRRRDNR